MPFRRASQGSEGSCQPLTPRNLTLRILPTERRRAGKRDRRMAGRREGRIPPSCGQSASGVRSTGCPDLFRSKVLATRRIDAGRVATPHTRMATGSRGTELSDLHMIVLGRIAQRAIADVDDIARWLGVPVVVAEILCADLKSRGSAHGD